jgi:hypothetical protein
MVPNWYIGVSGNYKYNFNFSGIHISFFTWRRLTPDLFKFFTYVQSNLENIVNSLNYFTEAIAIEILQEQLSIYWLSLSNNKINWKKLFNYNYLLSSQTYENQGIVKNLLFSDGEGLFDITIEKSKIIQQLGSTSHTYLEVDNNLCYKNYSLIPYELRGRKYDSYFFMPEFLIPFKNLGKWSFHKTYNNDLIIKDASSIIMSKRKGRSTIYDSATLKNTFVDIFKDYYIGCNIFELIFDLSYKRKGALIIYDPLNRIDKFVINKESLISTGENLRNSLSNTVSNITIKSSGISNMKKDLLLELFSVDGALIFNNHSITGFGSMIVTSPNVGTSEGARYVAAKSAQEYGFTTVLISSDGIIKILFEHSGSLEELSFY